MTSFTKRQSAGVTLVLHEGCITLSTRCTKSFKAIRYLGILMDFAFQVNLWKFRSFLPMNRQQLHGGGGWERIFTGSLWIEAGFSIQ